MGGCVSVNDGGGEDVAVSGSVNEEPRVTGVHQFTIRQYSRIKATTGVGKSVLSHDFTVAGRKWFIRFYPGGYNSATSHHVAFFLQSLYRPRFGSAYHVEFSFALLNPGNNAAVVHDVRCERPCRFDNRNNSWGIRKYITKAYLESPALGAIHGDDSLTVRCTMHVFYHRKTSRVGGGAPIPVRVPVPPSCHAKNAMDFLLSGDAPFDLEIRVGDATFMAHRMALAAQSLYFRRRLYGELGNEAGAPRITVHEMSPEAFGAVLHYVYHDSLPEEVTKKVGNAAASMARELFEAADMYAMDRMKLLCASNLCRFIDFDTVSSIMEIAEAHSCEPLKKACRNYMSRRRKISTH